MRRRGTVIFPTPLTILIAFLMSFNSDMSSMLTKIWPSAGTDAVFAILIVIKTECKYTTYFAIISLSDEKTDNN
jgi:hypothetical protein